MICRCSRRLPDPDRFGMVPARTMEPETNVDSSDETNPPLWDPERWWEHPRGRSERRRRARLRSEWSQDFPIPVMSSRQRRFTVLVLPMILAVLLLPAFGRATDTFSVVPVLSSSMEPDMSRGDVAVVVPVGPNDLRNGDVVVFDSPETSSGSIIHRVVAVDNHAAPGVELRTKGDSNARSDPWTVSVINDGDVSRRIAKVPFAGFVYLWLQSTAVRVAVLVIGIAASLSFIGGIVAERRVAEAT